MPLNKSDVRDVAVPSAFEDELRATSAGNADTTRMSRLEAVLLHCSTTIDLLSSTALCFKFLARVLTIQVICNGRRASYANLTSTPAGGLS